MMHPLSPTVDVMSRNRRRELASYSRPPHANYVDVVWRAGKLCDLQLLDEAAEARLARQASAGRHQARGIPARLRAAAGFALIRAGTRLQGSPAVEPAHLAPR